MTNKQISLKQLQKEVERERGRSETSQRRSELQRELRQLRESPNRKILRRFGRGFSVLAKKGAQATGKGIVAASKFAEERGAGEVFENIDFSRASPSEQKSTKTDTRKTTRRATKTVRRKTKRRTTKKDTIKSLREKLKKATGKSTRKTTRRARRKTTRRAVRTVTRKATTNNDDGGGGGFFGGLVETGF